MERDIAWRKWRDSIMSGNGSYHPLEVIGNVTSEAWIFVTAIEII